MNFQTKVFLVAWALGFVSGCSIALSARAADTTKIAIVDTGLNIYDEKYRSILCPTGHQDFTGEGIEDTTGHGTAIVGIFRRYKIDHPKSNFCLVILKYYSSNQRNTTQREVEALQKAISLKVNIVNYSGGGKSFYYKEYEAIKNAKNIKFIVAAGNDGKELLKAKFSYDHEGNLKISTDKEYTDKKTQVTFYPASYPLSNIIVVGNWKSKNNKAPKSNYGNNVDTWEVGTNIITDSIYPNATCNNCEPVGSVDRLFTGTSAAVPFAILRLL